MNNMFIAISYTRSFYDPYFDTYYKIRYSLLIYNDTIIAIHAELI